MFWVSEYLGNLRVYYKNLYDFEEHWLLAKIRLRDWVVVRNNFTTDVVLTPMEGKVW